jgi:hypothetical protein
VPQRVLSAVKPVARDRTASPRSAVKPVAKKDIQLRVTLALPRPLLSADVEKQGGKDSCHGKPTNFDRSFGCCLRNMISKVNGDPSWDVRTLVVCLLGISSPVEDDVCDTLALSLGVVRKRTSLDRSARLVEKFLFTQTKDQ